MLRELRIQSFAIIDRLEVKFDGCLNILTGETGSGKSIVVDGLDLLLGGRASSDMIRTGSEEAVLEAAFELSSPGSAVDWLEEMDLLGDATEDLIIRRILTRAGKSRATVNGKMVTMAQLQQLGNLLVDIHGQHEHQSLLKTDQQLYLLDAFGKLLNLVDRYRDQHRTFHKIKNELAALEGMERDRFQREDLLKFQDQEINSAGLSPGEDVRLEQERNILANAERISALAEEAYQALYSEDHAVLGNLEQVESSISDLSRMDERMKDASAICSEAVAQLQELAVGLRAYKEGIAYDPKRLEEIQDRLHLISTFKKKYAPTLEEILERHREIQGELESLSTHDERLQVLRESAKVEAEKCLDLARQLTKERIRAGRQLEKKVEAELNHLKMVRTQFKIRVETRHEVEHLGPEGADSVEFLVAPNPGEEPKPLARIASGGELSRIMLSLKSILAKVDRVPTMVFDEVDAGIGGGVAEVVGQRLKALAGHRQVLCITHLPQIASQADVHYTVEKSMSNGRATTKVKRLEEKDRVEEIARMLGGRETTLTAVKHAKEMLDLGAQ